MVASLELLAVLVGVLVLLPEGPDPRGRGGAQVGFAVGTDNQGNGPLVAKKMTTKYPFGAIIMELCAQLERRHLELDLRWRPREANVEADALTNGSYESFTPALRVPVDFAALRFIHLNELLARGADYFKELERARALRRV